MILDLFIVHDAWVLVVEGESLKDDYVSQAHSVAEVQTSTPSGYIRMACGRVFHSWRVNPMPDITEAGSRSAPVCDGCL